MRFPRQAREQGSFSPIGVALVFEYNMDFVHII